MKLLIIRHAIAMERDEFAETGQSDDLRPLTNRGEKRMKKAARGLRSEVYSLDHLATSPWTRAVQTAEIVSKAYDSEDAEVLNALVPGTPFEEFEEWCEAHADKDVIGIVGHEPHLSGLATWLLTGNTQSRIELGKGGACLIEFEGAMRRNTGTLVWLLTPRQLRALAPRSGAKHGA
jgi:phosphohistidine phosphatase